MPPPLQPARRGLQGIIGLVVGLAILLFVISRMDFEATWAGILRANMGLYLLAFLAFYPSLPLRAIRWQLLLKRVSGHIGLLPLCSILFRAWTLNCALPGRTGDLYAAYLVREEHGQGGSRTAGTILASRVLDLVVLVGLVGAMLFGQLEWVGDEQASPLQRAVLVATGLLVAGLLFLLLGRGLSQRLLPRALGLKYERFLQGFNESARWWRGMPLLLALTAVLWLLEAVRLGLVMLALGQDPPLLWTTFLALGAAVLTVVPLTPGGLGTVELFYQELFAVAGIPAEVIGPVILLDRTINYWFILLAGGALFLLERQRGKNLEGDG